MKRTTQILAIAIVVGLAGCATINVSSDYDPNADFSSLKTYSWAGKQPITGNPRLDNDILHSRVRAAVERELGLKGYQLITDGQPDFKVAYHVSLEDKLDVSTFTYYDYSYPSYYSARGGFYHGAGAWPVSDTYVYQYEEGTLLLDIVDPGTKQLIWRGTAKAEVSATDSPEKKEKRINKAIRKLIERFPR